MLRTVTTVFAALRSSRYRRVVNVGLTLFALAVSALVAKHFSAAGWPFERVEPRLLAAAAFLFVAGFALKTLGWHRLFEPAQRPRRMSLAAASGAATVTSAALPGSLDPAVRIAVVRRFPTTSSCVPTVALSLFMLSLVDAVALMPLSATAAATSTGPVALRAGLAILAAGGLGAALTLALLPRLAASGRLIRFRIARWIGARLTSHREAWKASLLVFASWVARATALFLLLAALDVSISFPLAIGFLCAAAVSGAIPVTPAGALTQAGAGAALLVASGIATHKAIDFAVSAQALVILAGASVFCFAALWHAKDRLVVRIRG